jgi:hypothetical protein
LHLPNSKSEGVSDACSAIVVEGPVVILPLRVDVAVAETGSPNLQATKLEGQRLMPCASLASSNPAQIFSSS